MARIVPYNPFAFPPSMEVRTQMPRGYDCKDAGGRAKSGTFAEDDQDAYRDVGGRERMEQVVERRVIGD